MRSPSLDRTGPGVGSSADGPPAERSPSGDDFDDRHLREPSPVEADAWAFVGVVLLVAGGIGMAALLVRVGEWVARLVVGVVL